MIEAAPAKVNLALHLRRRRTDGYHDLETLFAFTGFGDTVRAEAATELTLAVSGPMAASLGADNLVLTAARALAVAGGVRVGAKLTLDKHIPVAAGLGGGSADAAAALRLLNRFWGLDWPLERLARMATSLGADVPACVFSRTMVGGGRGDELQAADFDLNGAAILLVNPGVAVSTGPVFAGWDRIDRGPLDTAAWRAARNDLATPAIALQPVIATVLDVLAGTSATFVRMSGSGATCLALYDDEATCTAAAVHLGAQHPGWWLKATHLI